MPARQLSRRARLSNREEGTLNKQVYEYLNSVRVLHWRWLRLKAKHDELESCLLPAAIRYDKDKVQTSPDDPMSRIVAEINELEREMSQVQIAKSKRVEEIYRDIRSVDLEEERTALTMRFVNRISVSEIADKMGYSEKRIYQFMDQGAAQIFKRFKKD
jgi:DNA-directed RNA polymerase specialized sigma subunit